MALIVQKFGGTSLANLARIRTVAEKISDTRAQGHDVVVVVSAMENETNRLMALAKALQTEPDPRECAMLVSTGEQVTSALLALALQSLGCPARSYVASQLPILTDERHEKARIVSIDTGVLQQVIADGSVPVVAGFQGVSASGDITTLGRGGSDTTACALAMALQADKCQIYTDVDGVYTADPKMVPQAKRLETIHLDEMLELASDGAEVLQCRAVELAGKSQVPLQVLSSFNQGAAGTTIHLNATQLAQARITGLAFKRPVAKVTLHGLVQATTSMADVLSFLHRHQVEIDLLSQQINPQNHRDLSFTLAREDYLKILPQLQNWVQTAQIQALSGDDKWAKLSLVGIGLRSHPEVISQLFQVLGARGIEVASLMSSEIKISFIIDEARLEEAALALHLAFGLGQDRE